MNSEQKCSNCVYFRKLKHNFERSRGFQKSACCVVRINERDSNKAYVQEVFSEATCDMFEPIK